MIQKLSELESNTAQKTKLFAENFFGKKNLISISNFYYP